MLQAKHTELTAQIAEITSQAGEIYYAMLNAPSVVKAYTRVEYYDLMNDLAEKTAELRLVESLLASGRS